MRVPVPAPPELRPALTDPDRRDPLVLRPGGQQREAPVPAQHVRPDRRQRDALGHGQRAASAFGDGGAGISRPQVAELRPGVHPGEQVPRAVRERHVLDGAVAGSLRAPDDAHAPTVTATHRGHRVVDVHRDDQQERDQVVRGHLGERLGRQPGVQRGQGGTQGVGRRAEQVRPSQRHEHLDLPIELGPRIRSWREQLGTRRRHRHGGGRRLHGGDWLSHACLLTSEPERNTVRTRGVPARARGRAGEIAPTCRTSPWSRRA